MFSSSSLASIAKDEYIYDDSVLLILKLMMMIFIYDDTA